MGRIGSAAGSVLARASSPQAAKETPRELVPCPFDCLELLARGLAPWSTARSAPRRRADNGGVGRVAGVVVGSRLHLALIAPHGLAAVMVQAADRATRVYGLAAPLPAYLLATVVLYKRARAAGLIRFRPASGGDAA